MKVTEDSHFNWGKLNPISYPAQKDVLLFKTDPWYWLNVFPTCCTGTQLSFIPSSDFQSKWNAA